MSCNVFVFAFHYDIFK